MIFGMLQNKYPHIISLMKEQLENYVRRTEDKARATSGSYWYRFFEPGDPTSTGTLGTAQTWYSTFEYQTREHMLAAAAAITVPTGNAYVYFGWYLDFEPGTGGYVEALKQDVVKSLIPARLIYDAEEPRHVYLDFDHVIFGQENEIIDFIIYQDHVSAASQIGLGFPLLFRIASYEALGLPLPTV